MKRTALCILLSLWSVRAAAQEFSREALQCRDLVASVRPPIDEAEEGRQYLDDADQAYRNCRGSNLPLEIRVSALLKYAIASENRDRRQEAIAVLTEAIHLLDGAPDGYLELLIDVLGQAASAEARAGLRVDATAHAKRALEARIHKYGKNSDEAAAGIIALATVHYTFQDFAKTEMLLRDAIRIAEKACGPECDTLVLAYSGMESVYAAQGKTDESKRYAELAANAVPRRRGRTKE